MICESRKARERMRLEAARDMAGGMRTGELVRKYHVSRWTIGKWKQVIATQGIEGLRARKPPGKPPRIRRDVLAEFFASVSPTVPNRIVAHLLEEEFGIRYDDDHVCRLRREWMLERAKTYE